MSRHLQPRRQVKIHPPGFLDAAPGVLWQRGSACAQQQCPNRCPPGPGEGDELYDYARWLLKIGELCLKQVCTPDLERVSSAEKSSRSGGRPRRNMPAAR